MFDTGLVCRTFCLVMHIGIALLLLLAKAPSSPAELGCRLVLVALRVSKSAESLRARAIHGNLADAAVLA